MSNVNSGAISPLQCQTAEFFGDFDCLKKSGFLGLVKPHFFVMANNQCLPSSRL
jgi:hypothetical protein